MTKNQRIMLHRDQYEDPYNSLADAYEACQAVYDNMIRKREGSLGFSLLLTTESELVTLQGYFYVIQLGLKAGYGEGICTLEHCNYLMSELNWRIAETRRPSGLKDELDKIKAEHPGKQ